MIAKHDMEIGREFISIGAKACYSGHIAWSIRDSLKLNSEDSLGLIGDAPDVDYWNRNSNNDGDSTYFPPGTIVKLTGFKKEEGGRGKIPMVRFQAPDGKEYKIFWDLFRKHTRIK